MMQRLQIDWLGRIGVLFAAMVLSAGTATAQSEESDAGADDDEVVDEVVVTGTRLVGGDPTARVEVITAEDIAMQGLTTFEDVIRSLPQNFATINSTNNLLFGSDLLDANLGALGLGAATANLRGFGSKNTLVLLNGKRLAGINSSAQQLAANLNDIPAAAIDRVEILLDGGAAVYGSDSVAGVINVITKKDYTGASVGGKMEHSSTGGHARSANVYVGTGWGSGTVSAIVARNQSDPIKTAKTGYTTLDYSGLYGGDARYNFINPSYCDTRSGVVGTSRWGPTNLILPPGNDGRNAQPADFGTITIDDCLERIPADIGGSADRISLTSTVLQNFGADEQLQLRADLLYSETETQSAVSTFGFSSILIPASNAFNNFGHDVYVRYNADTEIELGLLPMVEQANVQEQLRYVLTATYQFRDDLRLEVDYTKAESSSDGDQYMFAPPSTRIDDAARYERLSSLIASPNPSEALNLFGDGSGQNPTIAEFYRSYANSLDHTHVRSIEPKLYGELFEIPGGRLGFVLGAESRKEWVEEPEDDFYEGYLGTSTPTVELDAYFLEATVPVIGRRNSGRFGERLTLSLQARYDAYSATGSVENNANGEPIFIDAEYTNTVYRVGVVWSPADNLDIQASRSEAFSTPSFTSIFGGTTRSFNTRQPDPLLNNAWVPVKLTFGPNPGLLPEQSVNLTISAEWRPRMLEGLEVKAAWSSVDLQDRVASSSQLRGLLPPEEYGNLSQFFVRDPEGNLTEVISRSINIARRADERLDLEVGYAMGTDFGTIRPRLIYHRVLDMFDQAIPGADEFRFFGESVGVDEYKLRGNVSLIAGSVTADLWVNYTPGYVNNDHENAFSPLPNEPVGSRTTTDVTVAYEMENGLLFRAGGRNIFDRGFPYMLSSSRRPYDSKRVDLRKRVVFFEVKYETGGW
ncbi:MAG: TonB-dependent receptor [Gammaproteobacteria bacterium]|nr:TonB-dependent receptor [Gammaproteobacteria bacterium]